MRNRPASTIPDCWTIGGHRWAIGRERDPGHRGRPEAIWEDPAGSFLLYRDPSPGWDYRFAFLDTICIRVSLSDRRISYSCPGTSAAEQAASHCLLDQVLPRVISHVQGLVLHASAVAIEGQLAVFLGDSGAGKSTLVASLHQAGFELVSDDALEIVCRGEKIAGKAVYRSLRLYPDTISSVLSSPPGTLPMAHYSSKRIVPLRSHGSYASEPLPIAALFFIERNAKDEEITRETLRGSKACLELIASSFALDPTDSASGVKRLEIASMLANVVPSFALSYPHRFECLSQIHKAVLDRVRRVDA